MNAQPFSCSLAAGMDMGVAAANAAAGYGRFDTRRMSIDSSRRSSDSNYMSGGAPMDYLQHCGPIDEYAQMRR